MHVLTATQSKAYKVLGLRCLVVGRAPALRVEGLGHYRVDGFTRVGGVQGLRVFCVSLLRRFWRISLKEQQGRAPKGIT